MASSRPLDRNEIADKDVYGNIIDGAKIASQTVNALNTVMTKTLEISNKTLQNAKPVVESSTAKEVQAVNKAVLENQKVRKAVLEIRKKEIEIRKSQLRLIKQQEDAEKRALKAQQKATQETREGRKEKVKATQARQAETAEIKREIIAERSSINSKNLLKNTIASLTIKLDQLEIGSKEYRRTLKQVRTAQNQLNIEMEKAGRSGGFVGKYSRALKNIPSLLGVTGGVLGFVQAVRSATRIIANFDTGLIKVNKTANLTDLEKSALAEGTIALSRRLESVSTEKLFELQEVAGQLGVKGTDNLLRFSEVLARLERSTNVVGQEGATNVARIINITGEDIDTVDKFGSALVELGNNSAASEAEILNTANEVARATAAYDLASTSVLGISAALTSLGAKPESAGTAIGSFFIQIERAVLSGSDSLTAFAEITGNTTEQLTELFNSDKEKVFLRFIEGLSQIDAAGGSVTKTLDNLDLSDKRVLKSLSPLATNFGVLAKSVELSNKAYDENTALTKESDLAFQSLNSRIHSLSVSWSNFILSLDQGNGFLSTTIRFAVSLGNEFLRLASRAKDVTTNLTEKQRRIRVIAQNIIFYTKVLGSLVAGFVAFRLAVRATNLVVNAFRAASAAAAITVGFLRNGLNGARIAMQGFNKATKANIIGLIAGLLATAASSFLSFAENADEATDAQKKFNDSQREGRRLINSIADIQRRIKTVKNLNLDQLNFLLGLIDDEITANENKEARLLSLQKEFAQKQAKFEKENQLRIIELENQLQGNLTAIEEESIRLKIKLAKEFRVDIRGIEEGITLDQIEENKERLALFKKFVDARIKLVKELRAVSDKNVRNEIERLNKEAKIQDLELELLLAANPKSEFRIRKEILSLEEEIQKDLVKQSEDSEALKAAKILKISKEFRNDLAKLELDFQDKIQAFNEKQRIANEAKNIKEIEQLKTDIITEFTDQRNKILQDKAKKFQEEALKSAERSAAKAKEISDKAAKDQLEKLEQQQEQLQFTQSVIRQTSSDFSEASRLRNQELDENVRNQERALQEQLKLAKNGDENLLAFRRQQLAKAQLERREELKRQQAFEEALQLSDIFLQSFSNRLSNVDANGNSTPAPVAAAGALSDTFLAKGLSKIFLSLAGFKEGTEDTGTVRNPLDKDGGRLSILHDNERVFTKEQNKMIGPLSNPEAAQIIYNHRISAVERNRDKPVDNNPQIERLIKAINEKPVPSLELNGIGELVKKEVQGQITTITKKRELKRYFNGS